MLVLSRRINESIVIGNGIIIKVQRIGGTNVTLSIEAPKEVVILRGELRPDPKDKK